MEFGFFGSAVLWMLVTFPAYWLFQWTIEGEPFALWQRPSGKVAAALGDGVGQAIAEAGASLASAAEPAIDAPAMS